MSSPAAYSSPRVASIAATALLAASGAATLFSLVADFRMYEVAGDLLTNAELAGSAAISDVDQLRSNASLINTLVMVATAAAFITWFYLVRVNAEALHPHGHRYKRGWAIGGWFTPVVALWFPRQIAGDIWQAGARPDELGVRPPLPQTLLNLWWGTFLAAAVLGRIGAQYNAKAEYADTYQQSVLWLVASELLKLAAAVFAVLVVRKVTAMQEQRFAESAARAYGVASSTARS
ncbi:DUF4328 domain-containing protein [Streptomyces sp. 1331.2]|uniref:DUF4328 domain-containing protein n=1 Tax=Streptomyces sp. 1331.2 TaxID=1938835 RepID=UPI000BCE839C|nr:DUF4328 domain-containing protein [Streptomyces sp. 1331.2]SOB88420.1 protein of unknown function [Streptomyces sp. 1331.2]